MSQSRLPYRQIHLDFHTSPYIDGIGAKFNREQFIDTLKKAHVNSINLFTKCHHGMYYYPTKIGTMHPNLHFDLFGEQLRACRENDIRALAYTCVSWNEDWADHHPEWLMMNHEGVLGLKKLDDKSYYSWKTLCYNNKEYQNVLKAELKEVNDLYHPDGFWIDIIQGKGCICKTCSEQMREFGLNPAKKEDAEKFDKLSETQFCKEFYEYIKSLNTDLEVYFNSFSYRLDNGDNIPFSSIEKRKYFDFIDIESLPSDQWGYTHFPIAANYLNKYDKELCMMNGKFHTAWGDFGSIRHPNALEYECFRAIANGARVCIGDQLHPSGLLEPAVYDRIGTVFGEIEKLEPWLRDTHKQSEIGVLIPTKAEEAGRAVATSSEKTEEGVYRILSELHLLFDFVNVYDSFEKYKLLILPDSVSLNDATITKIEEFVKKGGKLLLSGSVGLSDGQSQISSMEIKHNGKCQFDVQYLRLNQDFFDGIPAMDHILYEAGESVTGNGEVLAELVNPYFSRGAVQFCSHRQTPPTCEVSGDAGILRCQGGIYVSFPIFRLYTDYGYTVYRDVLERCICELLDMPLLLTDLPTITELTLRSNQQGYILHMLNYVISRKAKILDTIEEKYTVCNKFIKVRTEICPEKVINIRTQKEVAFEFEGGYTKIGIEQEAGYTNYFLKLRDGGYVSFS